MNEQEERDRFEVAMRAASRLVFDNAAAFERGNTGGYIDPVTQAAWVGWYAARRTTYSASDVMTVYDAGQLKGRYDALLELLDCEEIPPLVIAGKLAPIEGQVEAIRPTLDRVMTRELW